MRIKFIAVVFAACSLAVAQDTTPSTPAAPQSEITKIIRVHGDPEALANLAGHGLGVDIQANRTLGAVVVKGRAPAVADVERTIQELESIANAGGGKNIEVVFYLLTGAMQSSSANSEGIEILAPVVKQLRAIFPFKNYQLLSTILMRSGQNSPSSSSGILNSPGEGREGGPPSSYTISYDSATVSSDNPPMIHLRNLGFRGKVSYVTAAFANAEGKATTTQYSQMDIHIQTNVDLHEDQKVVVGTSNIEPQGTTLFLVVSAKLVP